MLTLIAEVLTLCLRLFGCFWLVGGSLSLQAARQASLIDTMLEAITREKEDRLTSRFLLTGAVLTLLSGLGLALSSRWVFFPLGLLVLAQAVYFFIKEQRFRHATTDEQREAATIAPATEQAFIVSMVVMIVTFLAWRLGGLS